MRQGYFSWRSGIFCMVADEYKKFTDFKGNLKLMKSNSAIPLALSLGIMLLLVGYFFGFCTDDPFISFRYADNFAHGKGLVFNPGDRVEGYSNFLFVAIMSLFSCFGVSGIGMLMAAKAVGIASAIGLFFLFFYAIRRFEENSLFAAGGTLLLLASNILFALWTAGGMETGLFAFLLVASAICRSRELEKISFPFSSILSGLLSLTRPEGVLYYGVFFLASLVWYHRQSIPKKHYLMLSAKDALIFISIIGAFELWRIYYYHAVVSG